MEGEEEGAGPEDLLEGVGDSSSHYVIRVLDVLHNVHVQLVVVEERRVDLAEGDLQIIVTEAFLFLLPFLLDVVHKEFDALGADQIGILAEEVEDLEDFEGLLQGVFLALAQFRFTQWLPGEHLELLLHQLLHHRVHGRHGCVVHRLTEGSHSLHVVLEVAVLPLLSLHLVLLVVLDTEIDSQSGILTLVGCIGGVVRLYGGNLLLGPRG